MPAEPPVLINNWWVYLRAMVGGTYGSSHLNPSPYQVHNAYRMRAALQQQGYDEISIAGVIGNAQVESGLSPGAIQNVAALPNLAQRVEDVPNSYMLQYYNPPAGGQGYGLGILQWDRLSALYQTNDLLGWENANGYDWYDGAGQMARLNFEFQNDSTYHYWHLNYGNDLTWAVYKTLGTTAPQWDAGEVANVWASCWELSSYDPTGRQYRRDNAIYWYDWFQLHPTEPNRLIWMLYKFRNERRGINVRKRF